MPKKRRLPPAATRNRPTRGQAPSKPKQFFLKIGKAISGLAVISGLLSFWPQISIEAGPQLDADNSMSVPFIVSNDGFLPLFSVNIMCRLERLAFENRGDIENSTASGYRILSFLAPHEKTTGPCHNQIHIESPIITGVMTVEVIHYPFIWVPKMTTLRTFRAAFTSDKKTVWLPQ